MSMLPTDQDARIALVIATDDLHGTAFNDLQADQFIFTGIDLKRPVLSTERDAGVLLNGRLFSHKIAGRKVHNVIITTNELGVNEIAFLENYWDANFKFISKKSGANWGNYIEVTTEPGEMPWQYLQDLEMLPEINLKLTEAR